MNKRYSRRKILKTVGAIGVMSLGGCTGRQARPTETSNAKATLTSADTPIGGTPTSTDTPSGGAEMADATPTITRMQVQRQTEWCPEYEPPRPSSNEEGLQPRSYPSYPASLTRETALTFAREHEDALRMNDRVTPGIAGYDEGYAASQVRYFYNGTYWYRWDNPNEQYVTAEAPVTETPENTEYIIALEGTVRLSDAHQPETSEQKPASMSAYGAWYKLTGPAAWRTEVENDGSGFFPEFPPATPDFTDATQIVCGSATPQS